MRIVSLVPSITELLSDLGLEEEVVGITKFCIHPQNWFREKKRIGGTKNIDVEKIRSLQPTLIIASKEENVKEQVEALKLFCTVWLTDVKNLDDALHMIAEAGRLTNRLNRAEEIAGEIRSGFQKLIPKAQYNTCYLIWKDPYMTVGGDTFIHDMMHRAGFNNIFSYRSRYPQVSMDEMQQAELIFLSSEPYPFKEKHVQELEATLPQARIMTVDGEMFSWYGSHLLQSAGYLRSLQDKIDGF